MIIHRGHIYTTRCAASPSIQYTIRLWSEEGRKLPDGVYWYKPYQLWPYREYTWFREDARIEPEEWDALEVSLESGWDPNDPAWVAVGKNGIAKVTEGNHRLAIARKLGIDVPVRFVWHQNVRKDPQHAEDAPPQKRQDEPTQDDPKLDRQVEEIMDLF